MKSANEFGRSLILFVQNYPLGQSVDYVTERSEGYRLPLGVDELSFDERNEAEALIFGVIDVALVSRARHRDRN